MMNSGDDLELEREKSGSVIKKEFKTETYAAILERWFPDPRAATLWWVAFCVLYWGVLVLFPCIYNNDLSNGNFVFWMIGMVGVCGVYYCVKAGHPADSPAGKPVMAFTCLLMSCDWIATAQRTLANEQSYAKSYQYVTMFCHSIAMLWASLFFYNRAIRSGERLAWMTLLVEWMDLIFICIAIVIISDDEVGGCFDISICWAYFVILCLQLLLWFFPIMLGFSDTEKYIHLHMIILDMFTDFPLIIYLAASGEYTYHWFITLDLAIKLILTLRSVAYHGIYSLFLKEHVDKDHDGVIDSHKQEGNTEAAGATNTTEEVR